jgi:purine nucleosidase
MRIAILHILGTLVVSCSLAACGGESDSLDASGSLMAEAAPQKIRVLLDTDANNELDDQHAIAYLLFNGDRFQVEGITVNRTPNGGGIDEQVEEAVRIVKLSGLYGEIPVLAGADGSFEEIAPLLGEPAFDGSEAVNFIIERAHAAGDAPLVLLPVGKLTNIALALKKDPSIAPRVRIVWLGSNYPERGEYNQNADEESLRYLLDQDVEFEMVTVRYGRPSGTDAVRVTPEEIRARVAGRGPRVVEPVVGRHGGAFHTFGDYSVNLFEHINLHGDPPSRALFDMAAVAIVKNPAWAASRRVAAPQLVGRDWVERPDNPRTITLWEDFDRDAIMEDCFASVETPVLAGR